MRLLGHFFFYKDILHKKNIQAFLFKNLNMPRSITKHTSNFHLDITPRSIKNKQLFA